MGAANPAPRFFCADAARLRNDPLAGTAPYGTTWILIEYPGGWPPNGFDGLALEPDTKRLVFSAAQAVRARILLIRRHGRRTSDGTRRWAVLRYESDGAHRQTWGTWTRDEDLAGIAVALDAPGDRGARPVVLVCAHGLHDACCAVRGRPVSRALSKRWPDLVWECTHVGGDRFAANVLVAPDGVYYGNLDAASAVTAVEEHLSDRVHADHLRGYTNLFPPQQTAVAALLARFGPAGRHHYAVEDTTRDNDGWLVRLTARTPRSPAYDVDVRSHRTPARQLTCNGLSLSSTVVYEAQSIVADRR
ncbi:sucrase ferredoxin [Streptomyces sp. YC504]|uniref:Sucrase ferredoxin n=1 Tax=Streptomyces mesophilus TaxID=1775132 RepID=A0A6G4XCV1_9ACTN|nr:sucrase ferredoxin [Streptomyces mesophilus]NGO74667.1 sucrase ferredoxin [Streptomyces mesophilus]